MIPAYPLQWPAGWPRTEIAYRQAARFGMRNGNGFMVDVTIAAGTDRVLFELGRMGISRDDVVISSDLQLRRDGLPRSGQAEPKDSGVAVYWTAKGGAPRVLAIDQYRRVAENLAAIAATLDALRAVERHGGARILDRAFAGFTALPAPAATKTWREVFEFPERTFPTVSMDMVRASWRRRASAAHPDRQGGSDVAMSELNVALAEAERELKGGAPC